MLQIAKWGQALRSAIAGSVSWLSPEEATCLACGRAHLGGPGKLPALCAACTRAIPWITRIVCPICGRPEVCPDCPRRNATFFIASRSAVRYDALIREWLAMYKYRGHEGFAPLLGTFLCLTYDGMMAELRRHDAAFCFDAVVPVPVSPERLIERGFNQAEQLASVVCRHAGLPLVHGLVRTRNSGKQSYKSRRSRIEDTRALFVGDLAALHYFAQSWSASLPQLTRLRLLLVDDIYTTGSTVNACAEAVLQAIKELLPQIRCEVYVLALARS